MKDKEYLETILNYIEERKWRGQENIDEEEKKRWRLKVWQGYEELVMADFGEGKEVFLVAVYFASKPDETVHPLLRRLKMVMENREDVISGGILAASYYGMEELSMRLPVLEQGIGGLSTDKRWIEALTGSIMIADGGPAEIAKVIQWYLFMQKNQFDVKKYQMARLIGLLAVISSSNRIGMKLLKDFAQKIEAVSETEREKERQDIFCEEACAYVRQIQFDEQEKVKKMEKTSYRILTGEKNVTAADYNELDEISLNGSNLLTGMCQEVELMLMAIHFNL